MIYIAIPTPYCICTVVNFLHNMIQTIKLSVSLCIMVISAFSINKPNSRETQYRGTDLIMTDASLLINILFSYKYKVNAFLFFRIKRSTIKTTVKPINH